MTEIKIIGKVKFKALFGCIVALVLAAVSCSEELADTDSVNVRTAYISLTRGKDVSVRSTIDVSGETMGPWPVLWATSDVIYYYTGKNSSVTMTKDEEAAGIDVGTMARKYVVPSDDNGKTEIKVEVKYADGDNKVVLFPSGKDIGAGTMSDMETLVIANGVPATQSGDFGDTHIGVAKGNLLELSDSSPNLTVTPVQAYLKFNMSDLDFGGRKVDKIVVKGKSGEKISGDMKVIFSGNAVDTVGLSGTGGTAVTISKVGSTFYSDRFYYVALMPGSYSGFKFEMYTDGVLTSIAEAYKATTLAKGSIVDLQDLKDHKNSIPTSVTMYPTEAYITQDMTKDVWVCMEPQDFDGKNITWDLSPGAPATMSDQRKEYFDGVGWCYGVTLTPTKLSTGDDAADYADRAFTVTATVRNPETGTTFATNTCTVTLGIWVDLGIYDNSAPKRKVLWCVGVLGYNFTTKQYGINYRNTDAEFGVTVFHQTEVIPASTDGKSAVNIKTPWGGVGVAVIQNKYGSNFPERKTTQNVLGQWGISGTYNTIDDPAALWKPGEAFTPTMTDCSALYLAATLETNGGRTYMHGNVMGYQDVYLWFPNCGYWSSPTDHTKAYSPGMLTSSIDYEFRPDGVQYGFDMVNNHFETRIANYAYQKIKPVKYI